MKDSTVRIANTLAFIGNNAVAPLAVRNGAHAFATAYRNAHFPAANAGQAAYEAFSVAMSLGWHLTADPNGYREMKRAAYMLTEALRQANPVTRLPQVAVRQITNANAESTLRCLLYKACIQREIGAGGVVGATAAQAWLTAQPAAFLTVNKLIVNGSPVRDPLQGDQNVLAFRFGYDLAQDRYFFEAGAPGPGQVAVNVDSITAGFWTDVPGSWAPPGPPPPPPPSFALVAGIQLASPIMVTTQFTGCSFCMKRNGGQVYCAHLAPTRGPGAGAARLLTGTALARELAGQTPPVVAGNFANFAAGGGFAIYGAGFSHNTLQAGNAGYPTPLGGGGSYMTIVGIQGGPDYQIFSQVTRNHTRAASEQIF